MGVSGSGKSTVGALLAEALGVPFVDGDALHPPENVAKMAAGIPLDDADRAPWLDAVGARLADPPVVIACSALRRAYRDRLRGFAPELALVYLRGDRKLLARRLKSRRGHFMPASLLDSQLATLERPADDERALVLEIGRTPAELVRAALLRWEAP
ncbi:gluconokinase [Protaetiibacter larvae]|uniref:Gluconokinase n=2 Tax=Protaetiibacter larvae TaxID=2592654 RepID=A0A5C1Y9M3_9MICO|nr:gluconokinase [Protaetiibacter larvae]